MRLSLSYLEQKLVYLLALLTALCLSWSATLLYGEQKASGYPGGFECCYA